MNAEETQRAALAVALAMVSRVRDEPAEILAAYLGSLDRVVLGRVVVALALAVPEDTPTSAILNGGAEPEPRVEEDRAPGRRPSDNLDVVRALAAGGWSDGRIAQFLGCSRPAVANQRRKHHIPPGRPSGRDYGYHYNKVAA